MQMLSVVLSRRDTKLLKHILNFLKKISVMFRWPKAQEIGDKNSTHVSTHLLESLVFGMS